MVFTIPMTDLMKEMVKCRKDLALVTVDVRTGQISLRFAREDGLLSPRVFVPDLKRAEDQKLRAVVEKAQKSVCERLKLK